MTIPACAVVTGGAGAVGNRLVRALLEHGVGRVVVVDDLSSGYAWLLSGLEGVELVEGDVCDLADLGLDPAGAWVFHLAAFFANQNSVDNPYADLHTNGLGTLTALKWAADAGARRVVYASAGCSIAGHGQLEPIREDMPVSLDLDTPYQITKALGEFYCNYFSDQVSTVRCRFFNSYGPGEVPGRYRNVIPNFIWSALHDQPLTITGSGEETRDFVFVDDLVRGLLRAAEVEEAHRGAYNLGTGVQTTVSELAQMIIDGCGSASEITYAPRRPWDHSPHRQADISRARGELDWWPSVPVDKGLVSTIEWFRTFYDDIGASIQAGR
jgi:nucleoside-diphosphate-sugar epimerase